MPKLTFVELRTEDVFQDIVRVHQKHRLNVPAGRICKMICGGKSVLLVARGARKNQTNTVAVDLRTRNRLGISSYGEELEVTFKQVSWFDEVAWGLQASEPISRIATRLAVISVALGLLGAILGAISLAR